MSKRKNQNSILVLATLGVYIGLVLVGATPQVLAQAAMTRQFDVRNEIDRQGEEDSTACGRRTSQLQEKVSELKATYLWFNDNSVVEYANLVEQLVNTYSAVDAFDVTWKSGGDLRPWNAAITNTDLIGAGVSTHEMDDDIIVLANGIPGKSFSFSAARYDPGYTFRFESHSFSYDTPLVRYLYNSAFDLYRCPDFGYRPDIILRHSEVKVEGKNLLITTHLPRGSLDALLASDAK